MRRYWYYTYRALRNMGCRVCSTCVGDFDIYRTMMLTESEVGESVVIDNWHEISKEQYEKLKIYFENQPK